MNGLMLHCGAEQTDFTGICAVPVPKPVGRWMPVGNGDLVSKLKMEITRAGFAITKEEFGLSKDGQQLFGVLTIDTGDPAHPMVIGFRNSYNKTLSICIVIGTQVFVCDNLCISGNGQKTLRKHTTNVWRDVEVLLKRALREALGHHENMNRQLDALRALPCHLDLGYEWIGRAMGHKILMPQQATVALADWREPRHEEFSERNMYSLYNCFTEGLKRGRIATLSDRHIQAHEFFEHLVPAAPVVVPTGWDAVDTSVPEPEPVVIVPEFEVLQPEPEQKFFRKDIVKYGDQEGKIFWAREERSGWKYGIHILGMPRDTEPSYVWEDEITFVRKGA